MPHLLEDLVVDRVDLVDEGANSEAFISLYKRKEHSQMSIAEILEKMKPEHATLIQGEIDTLTKAAATSKDEINTLKAEKDTLSEELTETKEALETANDDLAKAKSELESSKGSGEEDVLKSMPAEARALFEKMKAQKDAAEEAIRKAKEEEETAKAIAKAAKLKAIPVEQDKLAEVLKGCSTELFDVLETISNTLEETSLTEVGKSRAGSATSSSKEAWNKIEEKASEIAKSRKISIAKAVSVAVEENPDLYKEYLKGGAN